MARMERLNKYLAECGVASRRGADQIIADGRVKINGKVVTELGTKVNIYNDTIMVDDIICKQKTKCVVVMFNKPKGCVTTTSDEKGRKTILIMLIFRLQDFFLLEGLTMIQKGFCF